MTDFKKIIAENLSISLDKASAVIELLREGSTIPFIARYRKERTGGMDEVMIQAVSEELTRLEQLEERRDYIVSQIESQGKLTPELRAKLDSVTEMKALEDLYLPYKPKRRTRASIAKERGLEPFAKQIMSGRNENIRQLADRYTSNEVPDRDAAIQGAQDIISEWVSESVNVRNSVRRTFNYTATVSSKVVKGKESEAIKFSDYFNLAESLKRCSSHRYLAMRRGQQQGFLKVGIDCDQQEAIEKSERSFLRKDIGNQSKEIICEAIADGVKRLVIPSIENEVATAKKQQADTEAIDVFAGGLRQVLMASPLIGRRILGLDPGFRTGCKVVCIDESGRLLAHDVIYPVAPHNRTSESQAKLKSLIELYRIDTVALGNGTASRETEDFLRKHVLNDGIQLHIVSEQGASIYSASEVAREEFPDQDVTVRGAVSIARRLLDPLAELVKIDPKSIGVGQYQHDVDQRLLRDKLDFVVTSCVNKVGVNVNTASKQLLTYVSGIGPSLAENIVAYRGENGEFKSRRDLLNVPRLGEKAFKQASGFIRVPQSVNPLDNTAVHPERYQLVQRMANDVGLKVSDLIGNKANVQRIDLEKYITDDCGLPTLNDIVEELLRPGRDPRQQAENAEFDPSVKTIEDLIPGMVLNGKVTNLTAFGGFVDIGVKTTGLVHLSNMADRFIKSPSELLHIGQLVKVKVLDVDLSRNRISLSMKGVEQ